MSTGCWQTSRATKTCRGTFCEVAVLITEPQPERSLCSLFRCGAPLSRLRQRRVRRCRRCSLCRRRSRALPRGARRTRCGSHSCCRPAIRTIPNQSTSNVSRSSRRQSRRARSSPTNRELLAPLHRAGSIEVKPPPPKEGQEPEKKGAAPVVKKDDPRPGPAKP